MPQDGSGPNGSEREGDPFDWFLRIPNRLEMVHPLRALLSATLEARGVDEEDAQELLLVASEIVNNSIEHVKGKGPGGYHEVEIRFGLRGDTVVGRVLDEGEGAIGQGDFEGMAAPSIENDRGRGLFLIQAYVDELRVTPVKGAGTEIRFVKKVRRRAEGGTS